MNSQHLEITTTKALPQVYEHKVFVSLGVKFIIQALGSHVVSLITKKGLCTNVFFTESHSVIKPL